MATEPVDTREDVQVESTIQHDPGVDTVSPELEEAQDEREEKKEGTTSRDREPGKSALPFSRVQRIIKADKDLPMVAKDATFLISLAAEEFIKRLSQACQRLAEREKRTMVQQKDVANIVRRVDEFLFLEEIIGSQESTGRRRPQKAKVDVDAHGDQDQLQPTLRNFMQKTNDDEDTEETNIVMNEDGAIDEFLLAIVRISRLRDHALGAAESSVLAKDNCNGEAGEHNRHRWIFCESAKEETRFILRKAA